LSEYFTIASKPGMPFHSFVVQASVTTRLESLRAMPAIAPTWPAIGRLAAIGTIRTALNYFLTREMKEERGQLATALPGVDAVPPDQTRPPSRDE